MNDLGQLITNNIGSVVTTAIFIFYLKGRDIAAEKRDNSFNEVIRKFGEEIRHLSEVVDFLKDKVERITK